MKSMRYEKFCQEQLKDPELRREYDAIEEEFTLAREIIDLRKRRNLTQKELAEQVGTSQPAIARIESGSYKNISLSFLRRLADALGAVPEIHLRKRKA
ncbi:MAG: helix-turn-helix transcriptional regulator [Spirochaetia bacterium]|jgi:predicted transcriptional regulator|nr:helix-turn-helix domain-containing protein [Spirochaetales bacterium]